MIKSPYIHVAVDIVNLLTSGRGRGLVYYIYIHRFFSIKDLEKLFGKQEGKTAIKELIK